MLKLRSNPSIAFLDIFISNSSIGIIIGNPRIAIIVPLFEAFDAILEIMVNEVEKPIEPRSKFNRNNPISSTGFPSRIVYMRNPTKTKKSINRQLKTILEIIMD